MNLTYLSLLLPVSALFGMNAFAEPDPIDPDERPRADSFTILLLDFESTEDGVAVDQSGLRHSGKITGAIPCEGRFGKALAFDGEDDFVDCGGERGNPPVFDFDAGTDFTVELYMRTEEGSGSGNLINKKCSSDVKEPGWMILTTPGNDRLIALLSDGIKGVRVEHSAPVGDGAWHHVALVAERKKGATLYIDGVPGETVPIDELMDLTNPNRSLRIGDRAHDGDFKGGLDEVRISNVARSMKE